MKISSKQRENFTPQYQYNASTLRTRHYRWTFGALASIFICLGCFALWSTPSQPSMLAHLTHLWMLKGMVANCSFAMGVISGCVGLCLRPDYEAIQSIFQSARRHLKQRYLKDWHSLGGYWWLTCLPRTPQQKELRAVYLTQLARAHTAQKEARNNCKSYEDFSAEAKTSELNTILDSLTSKNQKILDDYDQITASL